MDSSIGKKNLARASYTRRIDKKSNTPFNETMRAVLIIVVVLGMISAFGFKLFIEPRLQKQIDTQVTTVPERSTSGFVSEEPTPTLPLKPQTAASVPSKNPTLDTATRPDKKALLLTFENLTNVALLDYTLSYEAKGGSEQVSGRIQHLPSESSISREIILGTCSQNVCVYDEGVRQVTVSVIFTFEDTTTFKLEKTYVL